MSVCRTILLGGCWCYLTIFSRWFSPMNMGWFIIMVGFDIIFIRGMTVLITRWYGGGWARGGKFKIEKISSTLKWFGWIIVDSYAVYKAKIIFITYLNIKYIQNTFKSSRRIRIWSSAKNSAFRFRTNSE